MKNLKSTIQRDHALAHLNLLIDRRASLERTLGALLALNARRPMVGHTLADASTHVRKALNCVNEAAAALADEVEGLSAVASGGAH